MLSDPYTLIAFWTAGAALSLTVAMAVQILWVHWRLRVRLRHDSRFQARWRPILLQAIDAVPRNLPAVRAGDDLSFLSLWIQFHESLRGPARHRLRAIALQMRMDVVARKLLAQGGTRERLVALLTLGHLGDRESWGPLLRIARSPHSLLSIMAARAMLMIDPVRAVNVLLASMTSRLDWPLAQIKAMLGEVDRAAIAHGLAAGLNSTPASHHPQLVALMDAADSELIALVLQRLLWRSDDVEVLVACLKSVHAPRDRPLILRLLKHSSWQVRAQSARVFPGVAIRGDEAALTGLLSDPAWWVRYRAAQSLVNLPLITADELRRLRAGLSDRFARDMLDQVMSEESRR